MIYDKEGKEYLAVPIDMMRHGVTVDLNPRTLGREEYFFI